MLETSVPSFLSPDISKEQFEEMFFKIVPSDLQNQLSREQLLEAILYLAPFAPSGSFDKNAFKAVAMPGAQDEYVDAFLKFLVEHGVLSESEGGYKFANDQIQPTLDSILKQY